MSEGLMRGEELNGRGRMLRLRLASTGNSR